MLKKLKIYPTRYAGAINFALFSFSSGLLYLSFVFVVFSPMPLLLCFQKNGRLYGYLISLMNLAFVGAISNKFNFFIYLLFVVTLSISSAECNLRKFSIEKSGIVTLLCIGLFAVSSGVLSSYYFNWNPYRALEAEIITVIDSMPGIFERSDLSNGKDSATFQIELDQQKRKILKGLPSAISIMPLILFWLNQLFLFKLNTFGFREKMGISHDYFRVWKTPDLLIWPTIVVGFTLLISDGIISDIAQNIFYLLMVIYSLQGLSILGFIFNQRKIRNVWRTFGFFVFIVFMKDLLVCLGFFDLWFDFRSKFRQS